MKISSQPQPVAAQDVPLEQLARNAKLSEAEKVGEVSRQFEALLLRQILQNARKTVMPSKLNPQTATNGIYQDLVTNQLADKISKSGALGLAATLRRQLTRELAGPATEPDATHNKVLP